MIAVTPPQNRFFKFTLDRPDFLAGRLGLKPLKEDDPIDTSSFESILLPTRLATDPSKTDPPTESLIARRFKTLREVPSSLKSCAQCHQPTIDHQLFAGFGPGPSKGAFLQSDPDATASVTATQKQASAEWKLYLRLRASPGK